MKVREASADDLPALIALGRIMHAEAPALRHATFSEEKVRAALTYALEHGCVIVHEGASGIDGGYVALLIERWFSTDRYVTDVALFVRPDVRGGMIAYRLVSAFIEWCASRGIAPQDVVVGISTGVNAEETGALYERLGFVRIGGIYQLGTY